MSRAVIVRLCVLCLGGWLLIDLEPVSVSAQVPQKRVLQDADQVFSRPEFSKFRNSKPLGGRFSEGTSLGPGGSNRADGPSEGGEPSSGSNGQTQEEITSDQQDSGSRSDSSRSPMLPSGSFGDFGAGMAMVFRLMGFVVLVAMIGVILWLVIPAMLNWDRSLGRESAESLLDRFGEDEKSRDRPRYSVDQYINAAQQSAEEHEFREAVGYVLLAAMTEIESRDLLKPRVGSTQRDYFRAVKRDEQMGPAFQLLLKLYEPLGFGRRMAAREHYEQASQAFERGFQ